jgi:hypothetical protein
MAAVGMEIVAGRGFTDRDNASAPQVAIVNQRFVDYYWPGSSSIGRHLRVLGKDVEIVGLTRTAKYQAIREDPQLTIYLPLAQRPLSEVTLHVRTKDDPTVVAGRLTGMIRTIDPRLPVYNVATLADHVNARLSTERVLNVLSSVFAILAVVVSCAGLYGLVAGSIAQRIREVGIRLAIGARPSQIVQLFARETLVLVLIGIGLGTPFAIAVAREFRAILFALEPADALTFMLAIVGILSTAIVAVLLPIRRATGVDPVAALRVN